MASTKLTIEGLPELQRRLEKTLPAAIRKEMGDAMVKSAKRIIRDASALVPRDSGQLAATLRHTEPRVSPKDGALYVAVMAGGDSTEVGAVKNFQLARIIEYGAQGRPAEPFFMPAWRRNKRSFRSAVKRAIDKALKAN
jgi:HK97 gp10 family phage protein